MALKLNISNARYVFMLSRLFQDRRNLERKPHPRIEKTANQLGRFHIQSTIIFFLLVKLTLFVIIWYRASFFIFLTRIANDFPSTFQGYVYIGL